jgi:hypothetical protein
MATASTFSATVTAKTGPARQATTLALSGLTSISVDVVREVISLFAGGEVNKAPYKEFDLNGVTTITDTITNGVHVIVIS